MDESLRQQFVRTVQDFTAMTGIYLPDDVEKRLRELRDSESIENAKTMYDCMIEDLSLAKELHRPLCQDTGVLQYFVEVGTEFPYLADIEGVLVEAARKATLETPLRPNVVEPLGEHNTGDNTGYGRISSTILSRVLPIFACVCIWPAADARSRAEVRS